MTDAKITTTDATTTTISTTGAAARQPATVGPAGNGEEHLTNGWEPDLPLSDSLLRRYLFCWAAATDAFALAAGGRTVRTPAFAAADYRRPSGFFNAATLLAPPEPDRFHAVVDDVEEFFAGGAGVALLWSAWPTPDLTARGWRLEGHPPLLVRPPARLVPPPAPPPGGDGTAGASPELVDVTDATGLADWERVAAEGYPLTELLPVRPGAIAAPSLLADPRLRFIVGRQDGDAVSIGALFVDAGIGCFTLGVTRPAARGGGHWRAHAIHRLSAAPDLWMTGIFSDLSRPRAERLGFVPLFRFTLWTLPRKGATP